MPPDEQYSGGVVAAHPLVEYVRQARSRGEPASSVAAEVLLRWGLTIDRHTMPRIVRDQRNTCTVCRSEFFSQRDSYEYCPYCISNSKLRARQVNNIIQNQKPEEAVPDELRGWGY